MQDTILDRKKDFDSAIDPRSLLKKLKNQDPQVKPLEKQIPNGELIPELLLTEEDLSEAVYAWIRATSEFNSMDICFAKNPDSFKTDRVKVHNYSPGLPKAAWHLTPNSLKELRDVLVRNITKYKNIVKISIEKSGITFFIDSERKFSHIKKATAKEIGALNDANKKKQESDPAFEYTELTVGSELPNPDYQPWLAWTV